METILNKVNNMPWEEGILLIPDKSIDLVITDPPYGIEWLSGRRESKHLSIKNDETLEWLPTWILEMKRVLKEDSHFYVFCSWHNIETFKLELTKQFTIKNILIWEKNNHGSGDLEGDYAPQYEMIIFCSNGVKKLNGKRDSNVIRFSKTNNLLHPTQKPIPLLSFLINKSSKEEDIVLDTFAGIFTTAIACKQLNRNFIGFEIEKTYCKIAKDLLNRQSINLF